MDDIEITITEPSQFPFSSQGFLKYRDGALVIETDPEISRYYFYLLSERVSEKLNKPLHDPHITLIGWREVKPENIKLPDQIGSLINFDYSPVVKYHNSYYYLGVKEDPIFIEWRTLNGLEPFYDKVKGYHITIANVK